MFPRLTPEENTAQVLRDLKVSDGAITDKIRKGRIDILAWKKRADGSFVPRYPIEVKKIGGLDNLINDVNRLVDFREVSPRGRKIRRAFIFACCVRGTKASVKELLTDVKFPDRSISRKVRFGEFIPTNKRNGTRAWFGSACYYF